MDEIRILFGIRCFLIAFLSLIAPTVHKFIDSVSYFPYNHRKFLEITIITLPLAEVANWKLLQVPITIGNWFNNDIFGIRLTLSLSRPGRGEE
jgi:hypothetical protein